MEARSACISVVPGSAYRPFLLEVETELDAEERECELVRLLSRGMRKALSVSRFGLLMAAEESSACRLGSLLGPRVEF
jgi:hypothetical protein